MKIVHICLSGLYMDGWGYQDNMLAKYHRRAGHDVSVIANQYVYDEKGNYKKRDDVNLETDCNDVKIYRLSQIGNKTLQGPAERVHYKGLYETLNALAPDVIFLHNPQIMDAEDIAKYMKENTDRTKLFVDSHSDYSNSGRNFLSKHILHGILWRNKVQKLVPYTKKFYGVLPARVDFMLDRYKTPKDKTELLCMGMDTELAKLADNEEKKNAVRDKLGIDSNDFFIITGGKIDGAKKQTLLLMEAVNKINDGDIKVKLVIFGSVADELKEEFDRILKDSVGITYIGWLDADSTYPYFAAADMAIFPGRHSVMWEQVAGQGIPMVVKYWEGTTHVDVGGNVKFLYKDSVLEIMEVIDLLRNKGLEYQAMKKAAVTNGPEHFSYETIARKCIE